MIARDAPATATLEAIARLAESLEPNAIAGVTIMDRAGKAREKWCRNVSRLPYAAFG
jgi:hypothetical protein